MVIFIGLLTSLLVSGILWAIKLDTDDAPYFNSPYRSLFYGPYTGTPVSPFSLSEYYEHIEKAQIDILQEKQNAPKHTIVLWFGLDGLQLFDNGHSKWISRKKQEVKPPPPPSMCTMTVPPRIWARAPYNVAPPPACTFWTCSPMQAGFNQLHYEMQQTCCSIEEMPPALVQEMLNDFMPPPSAQQLQQAPQAEIRKLQMELRCFQIQNNQNNMNQKIIDSFL